MRSVLAAALFSLVLVSAVVTAQWNEEDWGRLPNEVKTHFLAYDWSEKLAFSIMCFPNTEECWRVFLGERWEDPDARRAAFGMRLQSKLAFGDCHSLVLAVSCYGNRYWDPTEAVLTQLPGQYELSTDDVKGISDSFDGGYLRDGVIVVGLIRIPERVDVTSPFSIWLKEDNGTIVTFSIPYAEEEESD